MLKEMCSMISENEFVLNREKVFKNSKYIIIARLEKAEDDSLESNVDSKITNLKNTFSKLLIDAKKENKKINDNLREEITNN